jgi:hypothetical protein
MIFSEVYCPFTQFSTFKFGKLKMYNQKKKIDEIVQRNFHDLTLLPALKSVLSRGAIELHQGRITY